MALAKFILVKESEQELKSLMRKQPVHLKNRIQMLLVLKKSEILLSKEALSKALKINHNTAQKWRTAYSKNGIEGLLRDGRIGFKPSLISADLHQAIEKRLHSPKDAFTSYTDLIQWITDNYMSEGINYQTLNSYVKRHFGAKIKVARKSHVNKNQDASDSFKKTSL
ncbi:helix-turn-helix domain-containing protein [Flavobacterium marginilacus]|uniref:helix-turn-helix domain-containing protein n=1 Tax=Flavobacterium marginilacus TaxID=3003256 RepID=UPI00248EA690|nr:helix-turn-helix domain-containing protein [Flavobacterium marginilacus]